MNIYGFSKQNNIFFQTFYTSDTHVGVFKPFGREKSYSKCVDVERIQKQDKEMKGNYYFSPNAIKKYRKRNAQNVVGLNWCFADLDTFHNDYAWHFENTSVMDVYQMIREKFGEDIPHPTVTVFSGRGFYLFWKLKANESANEKSSESICALKRWKRLNTALSKRMADFNADMRICSDSARLFRVPGSQNEKSKTTVNIIESHPEYTYTLSEIDKFLNGKEASEAQFALYDKIQEYTQEDIDFFDRRSVGEYIKKNYKKYRHEKYGLATEKQLQYCKDIAKKHDIKLPKIKYYHEANLFIRRNDLHESIIEDDDYQEEKEFEPGTYTKMYYKRLHIIENSIEEDNNKVGFREELLFFYRYYSCLVYEDENKALTQTLELNKKFSIPLKETEVRKATKSAERYFKSGKEFKMKTTTFCERIGISVEDYRLFTCKKSNISNKGQRIDRKTINRNNYLKRLENAGKSVKKEEIAKRQESVKKYLSSGYSVKEIADILQVAESTIRRDLKVVVGDNSISAIQKIMKRTNQWRKKMTSLMHKEDDSIAFSGVETANPTSTKNSDLLVLYVRSTLSRFKGNTRPQASKSSTPHNERCHFQDICRFNLAGEYQRT